jgi:hypothetical protein
MNYYYELRLPLLLHSLRLVTSFVTFASPSQVPSADITISPSVLIHHFYLTPTIITIDYCLPLRAPPTDLFNNMSCKPEDIGFFYPDGIGALDDKDIAITTKVPHYYDCQLFIHRIKYMAIIKGNKSVQTNLHACLKGAAHQWYTRDLSDLAWAGLHGNCGISIWIQALKEHFKNSPLSDDLQNFLDEKFDAIAHRIAVKPTCQQRRQPSTAAPFKWNNHSDRQQS